MLPYIEPPKGLRPTTRKLKHDLVGRRSGRLCVLSLAGLTYQTTWWLCLCDCWQQVYVSQRSLLRTDRTPTGSCGCLKGGTHPGWRGYGEISGYFWGHAISGAKQRDIPFDMTIEQGWDLFVSQRRCCALTGLELRIGRGNGDNGSASLDRIDSKLGYHLENVQWLHKYINVMKWDLPEAEFIALCRRVVAVADKEKTDAGRTCSSDVRRRPPGRRGVGKSTNKG